MNLKLRSSIGTIEKLPYAWCEPDEQIIVIYTGQVFFVIQFS